MEGHTAFNSTITLIKALLRDKEGLLVVGICGAQGCGKSTLAEKLVAGLQHNEVSSAILSLDDLYLTHSERLRLAEQVHPLFATRGVPGTHDTALGQQILADLTAGKAIAMPRFDKAADDRSPLAQWTVAPNATRVLLFEGWCVGARPQDEADLVDPLNILERDDDSAGRWRCYANRKLATDYQTLFARLDCLVLLAAPSFEVVRKWRTEQEDNLRQNCSSDAPGLMDEVGMARFVQHYERLTRHILQEMPDRADMTIHLDARRQVRSVSLRGIALGLSNDDFS